MICEECYSADDHITPLLDPIHCLSHHTQYICGTCGRCICFEKDPVRGLMRWQFPYKSLAVAKLYLRAAEVETNTCCGIYELINDKGRSAFKIFSDQQEFEKYLASHKNKYCPTMKPIYQNSTLQLNPNTQIRKLSINEINTYIEIQERRKHK